MSPRWKFALLAVLTLGLGLGAFTVTHRTCCEREVSEIDWMRREFHLSDAQATAILAKRNAYDEVCTGHCAAISRAEKTVQKLEAAGDRTSPEHTKAMEELNRVSTFCVDATRQHVQEIAALMNPEDGKRYLALVLPKLSTGHSSSTCLAK